MPGEGAMFYSKILNRWCFVQVRYQLEAEKALRLIRAASASPYCSVTFVANQFKFRPIWKSLIMGRYIIKHDSGRNASTN